MVWDPPSRPISQKNNKQNKPKNEDQYAKRQYDKPWNQPIPEKKNDWKYKSEYLYSVYP